MALAEAVQKLEPEQASEAHMATERDVQHRCQVVHRMGSIVAGPQGGQILAPTGHSAQELVERMAGTGERPVEAVHDSDGEWLPCVAEVA